MQELVEEAQMEALKKIAKAFYQADRLTGTVAMQFGVRSMADSDGSGVVDVYLTPWDKEAAETLNITETAKHMQFLENMVPARLMGYRFILHITATDAERIELDIQTVSPPVSYTAHT